MSDLDVKAVRERHIAEEQATILECGCPNNAAAGILFCVDCHRRWPCDAIRALDRVEEQLADNVEWICERCSKQNYGNFIVRPATSLGKFLQPCPDCGEAMMPTSQNRRTIDELRVQLTAAKLGKRAAMERVRDACAERIGNHRGGYASVPIAIYHAQNDIATLDLDALESSDDQNPA